MLYLRLFLFTGLVFHKLVWEVLKRQAPSAARPEQRAVSPLKRFVKLAKSLVLLFLVIQTLFLDVLPISSRPEGLRVVGTLLFVLGLATAVAGRLQLGRNWANLEDYRVLPEQQLVRQGIYRFIRHPIYTGDLLLVVGLELALNSWLVLGALALVAVVVRQTLAEEAVLAHAFPGYGEYRKQSKMFIPFIV